MELEIQYFISHGNIRYLLSYAAGLMNLCFQRKRYSTLTCSKHCLQNFPILTFLTRQTPPARYVCECLHPERFQFHTLYINSICRYSGVTVALYIE